MAIQSGIERYIPNKKISLIGNPVRHTEIAIKNQVFPHLETVDFPYSDPWSIFMRRVIAAVREEGWFKGQSITEFGIGDGRNIREVGSGIKEAVGVEIEKWRLQTAGVNLVTGAARLSCPVDLWRADVVEFLQKFKQTTDRNRLSGWVIMCLPQSPEGLNTADRYDGSFTLDSYRTDWDLYGLTLNAATLDNLRAIADSNLRVLTILSDRVPPEMRLKMISKTGWQVERQFQTPKPIQQDPDTGVHWVSEIDDGQRFYELVVSGQYCSISAIEAEKRRLASVVSGGGRDELNVYHHLTIYQLRRSLDK